VAELSAAEKNAISHRGMAFRQLVPELIRVLGAESTQAGAAAPEGGR
jgi:hypothetical protein